MHRKINELLIEVQGMRDNLAAEYIADQLVGGPSFLASPSLCPSQINPMSFFANVLTRFK
jgi:hypothetical protein